MALIRRPRFVYGASGDLTLTWPALAWTPGLASVGSRNVAASGVPAAFIVREDNLIDLTLRLEEWEWPLLLDVVRFGLTSQSFRWYPDATNVDDEYDDSFEVYLEVPAPGERFAPARDGRFARHFHASITLRGVGVVVPWLEYFPPI